MSKHAYLLLNHGNHQVVEACIRMIDDPRNDIFVLTDPEEIAYYHGIKTRFSKLAILQNAKPIVWGGTVWDGMFTLIKAAAIGHYGYYHLLSESDLPIKSQDVIHAFFDNDRDQMIYMHVNQLTFKQIQDRCKVRYPFVNSPKFRKHKSLKLLGLIFEKTAIFFGFDRLRGNKQLPVIYNGWNWFSIPDDFAQFVVGQESLLHHTFDNTLAADEVFLQSLAMNSKFRYRMYGFNGKDDAQDASKRMINWNSRRWTPLVFTDKDFDAIKANKNCYFARKFYGDIDMNIVKRLEHDIEKRF